MDSTRLGINRLLDGDIRLQGSRFGMLTNDAARVGRGSGDPSRVLLADALQSSGTGEIVRVFSPEHGIAARAADGTAVDDAVDPLTGFPIVSLYGERLRPPTAAVSDLDAVLFDVPDAGARFYTYMWTLTHLIDACADAGVQVVVLDRPNPQTGVLSVAEGPMLDLDCCASFLGRLDIPITHQLTLGEIAMLWQREIRPEADVRVIRMDGWNRTMSGTDTGLPFVAPSPALTSVEAVRLYPGLCLFEAFNVSVGRGSAYSFRGIGAPWMRSEEVIEAMSPENHGAAVALHSVAFTPSLPPHAGERCAGVAITIRDATAFLPVAFGMRLVRAVLELHPAEVHGRKYPTAANPTGEDHLARLVGDRDVSARLPVGDGSDIQRWTSVPQWADRVSGLMLYS